MSHISSLTYTVTNRNKHKKTKVGHTSESTDAKDKYKSWLISIRASKMPEDFDETSGKRIREGFRRKRHLYVNLPVGEVIDNWKALVATLQKIMHRIQKKRKRSCKGEKKAKNKEDHLSKVNLSLFIFIIMYILLF